MTGVLSTQFRLLGEKNNLNDPFLLGLEVQYIVFCTVALPNKASIECSEASSIHGVLEPGFQINTAMGQAAGPAICPITVRWMFFCAETGSFLPEHCKICKYVKIEFDFNIAMLFCHRALQCCSALLCATFAGSLLAMLGCGGSILLLGRIQDEEKIQTKQIHMSTSWGDQLVVDFMVQRGQI
jgi:hypothetical protein